jgi:hypothetical protein
MGMIQIQITDELRTALERTHPGETVEADVQRIVEAAAAQGAVSAQGSLVERAQAIARKLKVTLSDDKICAVRHEGRL